MTLMKKEEILRRIREAEEEAKHQKEAALAEKDKILMDARREQYELKETLKQKAEKRGEEVLKKTEAATNKETQKILEKGRREAEALRTAAAENLDHAVERVIEKFKGALGA